MNMKKIWHWITLKRRTLAAVGGAYLALELLVALAAVIGMKTFF